MITLYHCPQTRSSRIIWLLEELGCPYAIKPVTIFRPSTGAGVSDPANPNPTKQVPAIEDDGRLVTESAAIVLYLTDAFPAAGIGPGIGDPQRGEYLSWLAWYGAELELTMFAKAAGETEAAPMKQRRYETVCRHLLDSLAKGPYLLGDRFSGADILVASALGFARKAFPDSEVLDAYAARCNGRSAAVKARELDTASGVQRA